VSAPTEQLESAANPAASRQGGEVTGGAAAEVPGSSSSSSSVQEDSAEAAAEAEAEDILRDWLHDGPWVSGKYTFDGSFDDLTGDVQDRCLRLSALALKHSSVSLVIITKIRSLLGGAGECRVTQDLFAEDHVRLCLLVSSVGCLDELPSTVPRPDEFFFLKKIYN
jgi:hypothetical protein